MWIKICGVQREDHARILAQLPIDALGLNRYQPSPRYISVERARGIADTVRSISPEIKLVGIYVDKSHEFILRDRDRIGLDMAQLHGNEPPRLAKQLGGDLEVIKAFQVDEEFSPEVFERYPCSAFLLDAYHPELHGGTGETAPWERIRDWTRSHRIILAGGLNAGNVVDAIRSVRPWGVDVCSGVENERGEKDVDQVKQLLKNASETR